MNEVQFKSPEGNDTKNFVKFHLQNADAIVTVYVRPKLGFVSSKPLNITLSQDAS